MKLETLTDGCFGFSLRCENQKLAKSRDLGQVRVTCVELAGPGALIHRKSVGSFWMIFQFFSILKQMGDNKKRESLFSFFF